jgi:hypothetical protein
VLSLLASERQKEGKEASGPGGLRKRPTVWTEVFSIRNT